MDLKLKFSFILQCLVNSFKLAKNFFNYTINEYVQLEISH